MIRNGRNGLRRYYNIKKKRLIEWDLIPNIEIDTLIITDAIYEIYKEGELYKEGNLDKEEQWITYLKGDNAEEVERVKKMNQKIKKLDILIDNFWNEERIE